MHKGWIKLHRKILDNRMLKYDHNAYIIFTILLMSARRDGSYDTGRFKLAELIGINPNTVYATLKRLEKSKMITQESNNKYTVIRICNWKKYQGDDNTNDNSQITSRQQPDNTKQELIIENKENSTNVLLAKAYGNSELNKMFDYWTQQTGTPISSQLTANRRAASNLLRKYGDTKLEQLIKGVALAQDDQYAPRIANFIQLQSKTDELILWGKKKSNRRTVQL